MQYCRVGNGEIIAYEVEHNNIKVRDSYRIHSKELKLEFIDKIILTKKNFLKRSRISYYREWKAHNILYKWNYQVERTRDTDFNAKEYLRRRIGYFFISLLFKEKE